MNVLRRLADPTLIVVSVVYGIALVIAQKAILFGLPLALLVLLSVSRYGYEVLRTAAQGRTHLPAPAIETMNPVGDMSLVLHFVLFASLTWLLSDPPVAPGSLLAQAAKLALFLVVLAFPASAALLAITRSLEAAVDPRRVVLLITEVGWPYAAAPALAAGLALVAGLLDEAGGALLGMPVAVFALFAVFLMTGVALRSARHLIEIPGEKEPEEEYAERMLHRDWQAQLDAAYASIRSGLIEQGYRTIRSLVETAGFSDAAYGWVLDRMLEWEDRSHARAFGAGYVERLLGADRKYAALELAAHLRDDRGRIVLPDDAAAVLAEYAQSIGRYRLADELRGL